MEQNESAKEVAGKSIGRFGLFYITLIVLIGVGASYFLTESAITAVMTMIGGALVALIQMMQGITGTKDKEEKPEVAIIKTLIDKDKPEALKVSVDPNQVTVQKGEDVITTRRD